MLVILSLAFALAIPRVAQRRITHFRNEINDAADPARLNLAEIQLEIAIQASQRRGYLLTGDEQMAQHVTEARVRRIEQEVHLVEFSRQLDTAGSSDLARLAVTIKNLDHDLDSLLSAGFSRSVSAAALGEQRRRFLIIQAVADSLDAGIDRAAVARRTAITNTETVVAIVTALLLLLGLGAAVLVARLGSRYRALALRFGENEARFRQIAERERAARAVVELREAELERVTASRNRLLRGFTHDVKNPLGAADGYLSLLEGGIFGEVAEKARATVTSARRLIGQALELIKQLLEIAQAEAGELEVLEQPTDVVELVRDVTDSFQGQAAAKSQTLRAEFSCGVPTIETDPGRLRQIIGNLVSNAVKYTPNGGHIAVRVGLGSDETTPGVAELIIAVSDDGPGIPQEKLPMLFKEFTRFHPGLADGAGIGLAISQKIAQALGAEIAVESALERGSTFSLRLMGARHSVAHGRPRTSSC